VLATLSVVFAFVFAPVGALLGHLGLAQIHRSGERGRDRALIGLTLSYTIIVITVVALVIWGVIGSESTTSHRVASPTASAAVPGPITSAVPQAGFRIDAAMLPSLLLSLDEMKEILNAPSANGWETITVPDLTVTQTRTNLVSVAPDASYNPLRCLPAMQGGTTEAYENSGYTATLLVDMANPANTRRVTPKR